MNWNKIRGSCLSGRPYVFDLPNTRHRIWWCQIGSNGKEEYLFQWLSRFIPGKAIWAGANKFPMDVRADAALGLRLLEDWICDGAEIAAGVNSNGGRAVSQVGAGAFGGCGRTAP